MRQKYSSFGGVMLWDASQAWANGRFQATVKAALVAAGGTGFTYPACSAPAWASGASYSAGQQVTYQGYIWQAKWYASDAPNTVFTGDWQVGKCPKASCPQCRPSSLAHSERLWRRTRASIELELVFVQDHLDQDDHIHTYLVQDDDFNITDDHVSGWWRQLCRCGRMVQQHCLHWWNRGNLQRISLEGCLLD
jgi:hypothetical protein